MVGNAMLGVFPLPSNLVCDAFGARVEDVRSMTRSLSNMLVWNLVIVLVVVLW